MSAVSCTQRVYTRAQTKAAVIISYEDEGLFWRVGVLGYGDLRVLLNTVSSSMLGCISAFVEDKNKETFHFNSLLVLQQMIRSITVIRNMSMLNLFQKQSTSLKDIRMKNKSVKAYANPGSDKCMVRILDFYKSIVPSEPKAFYLRPLEKVPNDLKKTMVCSYSSWN